ncbi:hypothetical protein [Paeniglutamicibacter cryotolerans]|uniref:Asparagine N-glycosylation enzyme membrane subunit Stt3 n=1 Tax=Paeniglutamicibacter cryotolerans TaxID=670079 RepID=A0A839QHS1_9MICC|nr:hypothetical protein [Paeniglutamicibacter cryotolerans]MBB2994055.1 asparagine N-glycosylation enzyme membrane subunit Stt3 [Paeniglutamicibacter cryotolerans]
MRHKPGVLRLATGWWLTLALAALAVGAGFFGNAALRDPGQRTGFITLGLALCGAAVVLGTGGYQLWRGRLAGRTTLTWFGLIAGIPMLTRGLRFGLPAMVLLIGVVLLWLPASMSFFKDQSQSARAARKAERSRTGR